MYAIVLHGDRLEMIVLYTLKCRLHFLSIIYILCLQNTIQINLHQRKANTKRYTSQPVQVYIHMHIPHQRQLCQIKSNVFAGGSTAAGELQEVFKQVADQFNK